MSNTSKQRVIVAMSGGVDSSVAAALLVQAGYQVEGLMLRLWSEPVTCDSGRADNRCCTPDQLADAQNVAEILNIPFRTLDVSHLFRETVVDNFIAVYAAGQTPNPCIICNRRVRFGFLFEQARAMGADYLATGHYVRIRPTETDFQLMTGVDASKDQSYVLHMLNQSHLPHLLFPVGQYTKTQIRQLAAENHLPVATKPESQDICFLADGDYRRFLRQYAPHAMRPGPIIDLDGNTLGHHEGLPAYTIGQRKGLRVSAPRALYVLGNDPQRNALVVGPRDAIQRKQFSVVDTRWVAGNAPKSGEFSAQVRIRYRTRPVSARLKADGSQTQVELEEPLADISPGQAAVFYHQDVCLGGGTIALWEALK